MNRIYSPSPTVRSSVVPLYMRGVMHGLGQDDDGGILFSDVNPIDTTIYDPGGLVDPSVSDTGSLDLLPSIPAVTPIDTTMYDPTTPLVAPTAVDPQTAALAQMYQSSVAAGTMTQAQANSAIAALATASASVAKGLTTAPAPRVALPAVATAANPLTAATVIPGVPNYILLAAAAVAALAMGRR
jgi:hypothetical protein